MSLNEMFARMAPGNIATIAGAGYVEGVPAREAPAGWPMGIARNAAGDLFVVDYWGHRDMADRHRRDTARVRRAGRARKLR